MNIQTGPTNPFLADSSNPVAHGRCDQQDNISGSGPEGPSEVLGSDDICYVALGPGHFGGNTSGLYPDGRRVIWTNGRQRIIKLDYETLEVLATLPTGTEAITDPAEFSAYEAGLDDLEGDDLVAHAIDLALRFMTGLDGIYSLLDCDHTLFLGRKDHAAAYVEVDPADPASAIVERDRWYKPEGIDGFFVGMNITFDGRLVMTTDHGWVVCLARDFSTYDALQLPGSEIAAEHCAKREAEYGHTGYGWVRTSSCVGDDGGIYVCSVDTIHKVIWTGERLSLDPADGAWSARYRNGGGNGTGTTPSLMGFGPDEDRFVVIGDGDEVVNITLLWRDEIPEDWEQLPDAPSRRIAGIGRANMGDPDKVEIKTEQSITVSGYGAMTVNNEPASIPAGWPVSRGRMFSFFLGHKKEFTPYGLHKYEWDPKQRCLREAWVNTDVSSPNSVPFVAEASNLVYTCGTRGGKWTMEALDWSTGESRFHYVVGGSRFNTLGAGVTIDEDGHLLYGTIFGKTRLLR